MISKILKLKDFGIFHDFSWKSELHEFKKFNLIYGWNRSGKTTISRVFSSCEKKSIYDKDKFNQYPENGEFEIKMDDGTTIKNSDVATNSQPIKVFNQDFIDDNISFDPSDSCNPIIYISEEDIESKKRLGQLNLDKVSLSKDLEGAKKDKVAKETAKSDFLTGLGREIANILFDKSYNKTKAENKINTVGVDNFTGKVLSDEDKRKYETTSKSEAGKNQDLLEKYQLILSHDGDTATDFKAVNDIVKKLLGKKVVSVTLDRLKNDHVLNTWVKQGFDLHKTREEKEKCLFCQNTLEANFLESLSKHFSKDYEDLQNSIVQLKNKILGIKKNIVTSKNDDLYVDLKENYIKKAKDLNNEIGKINIWLDSIIIKLDEKYTNPLVEVTDPSLPEDFLTEYDKNIAELNKIITEHNEKVKNHSKEVLTAKEKLEIHSIATALIQQDYKKMGSDLKNAGEKEVRALQELNKSLSEISELEKQNSNIGKAIKEINKYLKEFFGREEIKLEMDGDKKGYIIKRDGQPAKNLSEGEKTAVAFSYFVVKVGEGDFDKSKGIILIDDPISSFDSNFIYHCFSLINNHFNEVGQLFISTHNFQLFNLVKDWFINKNNHARRDNIQAQSNGKPEKPIPCEFFMVENFIELGKRKAKLVSLDKTLRNYKSEYHFLFSKLNVFSKKVDTEYDDFYTIGNMARRFFDIFADFKIPSTGDQKSKMDTLISSINEKNEIISKIDAGKAYKLVNEFSHNYDPTSTIEHKDKSESKDAINVLLSIVKESDPKHFDVLSKSIEIST